MRREIQNVKLSVLKATKAYGDVDLWFDSFLSLVLDKGTWSALCITHFTVPLG
jgi:hypothetical protein